MGNVYRTSEGNLVLYTQEERVYLRTLVKEGAGRAVVLTSDYGSDLTDVLYRGTVYYAYINIEGDVVVRNISGYNVWNGFEEDGPKRYGPRLAVIGGELTLFYSIKNPLDGHYCLGCKVFEAPERENSCHKMLWQWGSLGQELPNIQVVSCPGGMLMVLDSERMIWWDEEGRGTPLSKDDRKETRRQEDAIRERYEKELDQKDRLIESIKQQYEELMQVAQSYRQEAIKWRSKFTS